MLIAYGDGVDEFTATKEELQSMDNVAEKIRL